MRDLFVRTCPSRLGMSRDVTVECLSVTLAGLGIRNVMCAYACAGRRRGGERGILKHRDQGQARMAFRT